MTKETQKVPLVYSLLSPREKEVLSWTACGKTGNEISQILGLSEETIWAHIKTATRKLNATNKTHAVAIALTHGFLNPGPSPKLGIPLTILFGLSMTQVQKPHMYSTAFKSDLEKS